MRVPDSWAFFDHLELACLSDTYGILAQDPVATWVLIPSWKSRICICKILLLADEEKIQPVPEGQGKVTSCFLCCKSEYLQMISLAIKLLVL